MNKFLLALVVAGLMPAGSLSAQATPAQASAPSQASETAATMPKFEVASIKPTRSGNPMTRFMLTPGRLNLVGVPTKMIIEMAYNLKSDDQIVGAPSWVNSERFDIDAKEEDSFAQKMRKLPFDEGQEQVRLLVQSLLADRFKLKVRRETRQLPVFALIVAKNGPKLTESKLPPPSPIGANTPGPRVRSGVGVFPGKVEATSAPISLLVSLLSRDPDLGGRTVVDETGLKGSYDFTLKWTPEFQRGGMAGGPGPAEGSGPGGAPSENGQAADSTQADASGPSLFTALQEQLGLRLKPAKGPVEVLVIDHIEPPTPN